MKNLTWQNPEQLFVAQELINKVKSKCCGIKDKVRQLNDLAKQRGQTLAEMAIAWLLKDDRVTSVLVGASSVAQLIDNLKALQNTAFSAEEIQMIENILQ